VKVGKECEERVAEKEGEQIRVLEMRISSEEEVEG